jgi:hypothetical protein
MIIYHIVEYLEHDNYHAGSSYYYSMHYKIFSIHNLKVEEWGCNSDVEHMLSMHETLDSILST